LIRIFKGDEVDRHYFIAVAEEDSVYEACFLVFSHCFLAFFYLETADLSKDSFYLIFGLFAFEDVFFGCVRNTEFLAVEDGVGVFVADDEDVQSEVLLEFFDTAEGQMMDEVVLEVEGFQTFGVVFDEDGLALGLGRTSGTYCSCLTRAQIMEV
jgi:hypothetical protein